jgi:pimeloyl-ACP methyl ester carboxylesterase
MIQLVLHRLGNQLSNFSQPTLVIGGDEDTTVFIQRQQKLSKLIPGASMVIINGGGHGITVDSVEQFNQSFFEFLAD